MKTGGKFLLAAMLVATSAAAAAPKATLELRAVIDCKASDTPMTDPVSGDKLCFSPGIIFDRSNILDAKIVSQGVYGNAIRVTLDVRGAAQLAAATANIVPLASRIGFIYNGRLISALIVRDSFTGKEVEITGPFGDSLDAVVADLKTRP